MDNKIYDTLMNLAGSDPSSVALVSMAYSAGTFADPGEPFFDVNNYTIGAGIGTTLNNQQITLNLDFDIFVYGIAAAPYTVRSTTPFSFLLKSNGGQVLFGNAPMRTDAVLGLDSPILWLRRPFKVLRGVNMTVDLTNLNAGALTVQLVLLAWKSESAFR